MAFQPGAFDENSFLMEAVKFLKTYLKGGSKIVAKTKLAPQKTLYLQDTLKR